MGKANDKLGRVSHYFKAYARLTYKCSPSKHPKHSY